MSNNTRLNTNVTSGDLIATEDIGGTKHELVKVEFGADGVATKVSATDPLPVTTDGLTDAELRAAPVPVSGTVTVDTSTLATAAKQDTGNSSLSSILAKIITAPATEAKQDIGNTSLSTIAGKDFATQTTLALIKAKTDNIDVALSSRTKPADQQHVIIDSGTVTVDTSLLATAAKQDTGNGSLSTIAAKDFSTETTLAAVLAKLSSDPATQTTLAAILAKIIAAPSTEAKQDTGNTSLASIDSKLTTNPTQMLLSGSTNGKGIKVTGTSTGATVTIHTATSNNTSTQFDEIYLYAYNGHTADVVLTIEWGEATVPDGNIVLTVPFKQGRVLPVDGRPLNNSLVVKAFAATANVIIIDGFIKRYS